MIRCRAAVEFVTETVFFYEGQPLFEISVRSGICQRFSLDCFHVERALTAGIHQYSQARPVTFSLFEGEFPDRLGVFLLALPCHESDDLLILLS